jgi:hypothetical protein
VRALRSKPPTQAAETVPRKRRYNAAIRDAVTALWEASDRVCGKRLEVMIPALLPALERHDRQAEEMRVLDLATYSYPLAVLW